MVATSHLTTPYRGAPIDLALLRGEIEAVVGPLTGRGLAKREVAGRALEAIILRDHLGWTGDLISQRLYVSIPEVNYLVRRYRDIWAGEAQKIFNKLLLSA